MFHTFVITDFITFPFHNDPTNKEYGREWSLKIERFLGFAVRRGEEEGTDVWLVYKFHCRKRGEFWCQGVYFLCEVEE